MTKISQSKNKESINITSLTVKLTVSYLRKNYVPASDLTKLVHLVHGSLNSLIVDVNSDKNSPPKPAVPVKKSIHKDFIICLEDGKKLKMLKRHLRTTYDMSPDEYRAKWKLSRDYPMVAPSYAAQRSALAKKIGLGQSGRKRRRGNNR